MKWSQHKKKWKACEECSLCEVRDKVVVANGQLPADIVVVGDAPGESENATGTPYIGPAGVLIKKIMDSLKDDYKFRVCYTYLVGCIPKKKGGGKKGQVPAEAIKECQQRLFELDELAKPKAFVCLGKQVEKHMSTLFMDRKMITITAPYSILAESSASRDLSIQRVCVDIADLLEELELHA